MFLPQNYQLNQVSFHSGPTDFMFIPVLCLGLFAIVNYSQWFIIYENNIMVLF